MIAQLLQSLLLLGLLADCAKVTDHLKCHQQVNMPSDNVPFTCMDVAISDPVYNDYNWDNAADKSQSVNAILFTAPANFDIDAPDDCPFPAVTLDGSGTRALITGGWSVRPDGIGQLQEGVYSTNPWYVSRTVGFKEHGKDAPGVQLTFSGWVDYYGNAILCELEVKRPVDFQGCMC